MNSVEGHRETLPSILLVDDDEVLRERLATAIRARGYEVRTAGSSDEALREIAKESPEMAVLDLRMPGGGGLELLQELRRQDPSTRVLMLTGYGSISTAVEAVREGAVGYLPKPADADEILAALNGTNTAKETGDGDALARARGVGAHPARAHRLRRQHLGGRAAARDPPSLAAAEAAQVPAVSLKGAAHLRVRGRQCAVPGAACPCRSGRARRHGCAPNPFGARRVQTFVRRLEPMDGERAPEDADHGERDASRLPAQNFKQDGREGRDRPHRLVGALVRPVPRVRPDLREGRGEAPGHHVRQGEHRGRSRSSPARSTSAPSRRS